MREKHTGGRGRRTEKPYDRLSITMHPELRVSLDALAQAKGLNRSEAIEHVLDAYFTYIAPKQETDTTSTLDNPPAEKSSNTAITPKQETGAMALPDTLRVLKKQIPKGQKWKPEKYALAEELLSQGEKITRIPGAAGYQTATGAFMSWRTVAALLRLEVLTSTQ